MTREQVIKIRYERDPNKKEELLSSYAFDAMYAIQEGVDSIVLKSQGLGINICADLALEIKHRLSRQLIPVKMKVYINSRFPKYSQKYQGKTQRNSFKNPKIVSFLSVKFMFSKTR
jgi:hypothetical protein